ncbi:MAG: NADP-dependent oxidoreductase [Rhodospirillaceae bacterium]|nr:MAG: NADP-dependent oxidoreductase [Rhodospirillaceae bacterium]
MTINRSWLLARRPQGRVSIEDFAYREEPFVTPTLADGEVLVRNHCFSCAPTIRNWLNPPERSYRTSIGIGQPIAGMAGAEIMASRHPRFSAGDYVTAVSPWQDYAVLAPDRAAVPVVPVPAGLTLADALGPYSPNSLTAYFGMIDVGRAKIGETVLISAAAGSVGTVACQIARIQGCRVVAIAGGPIKCAWLRDVAGVDATIDYKAGDLPAQLAESCPTHVNLFFDNVGGEILQAAVDAMALHGRIVLCGQISSYDTGKPAPGPRDMMRLVYGRILMQGFVVGDFAARYDEAYAALRQWIKRGDLICRTDLREGFDRLPEAFVDLFRGNNEGTLLVSATSGLPDQTRTDSSSEQGR